MNASLNANKSIIQIATALSGHLHELQSHSRMTEVQTPPISPSRMHQLSGPGNNHSCALSASNPLIPEGPSYRPAFWITAAVSSRGREDI